MTKEFLQENPLISKAAGFGEETAHFFIKDKDHPYIQEKPFDWIRGYQVGGKSLTWGRACALGVHQRLDVERNLHAEDARRAEQPLGVIAQAEDRGPGLRHGRRCRCSICG